MQLNLNLKSIKQSAANLSLFLKSSGHDIPKSLILEALAKVFFFKNWNTFEAKLTDPLNLDFKKVNKKFVLMEVNQSKEYLLNVFHKTAERAKAKFEISDIKEKDGKFLFEFDFLKTGSNNFITFWFFMAEEFKKDQVIVKECYYWRVTTEKEDLFQLFNR